MTSPRSPRFGLLEEVLAPSEPPIPQEDRVRTKPNGQILRIWRNAQCVCFDVDCTVTINDGLDLLAEFKGVGLEVAAITNAAMDGSMSLEEALLQRLNAINPSPDDIRAFLAANPPESRIVPGAKDLIAALQARGVAVYLISGGFRELSLPIAKYLNIPPTNLFSNRMNWQFNDETGEIDKLIGFDDREPTGHQYGKPKAISQLRMQFPYETIVMIGDGITDLEAVQKSSGADLFIGFGGVVQRPAVREKADWFVDDFETLKNALKRHSVSIIGSGAWACAAIRIAARNALKHDRFCDTVKMWVYEEEINGVSLTQIINKTHENVKYLPGAYLGENVVATNDMEEAVTDASILIICLPHQFVTGIVRKIQRYRDKMASDVIAVSLTKGMRVRPEGPQLISELVRRELNMDCSVLMGPNLASEVVQGQLTECTIGYNIYENAHLLKCLFETENFYVSVVHDVVGVEMAGTLKNIIALAVGFVEGSNYGYNTRSSIMRAGLGEMMKLAQAMSCSVQESTFYEACGIGDLIASCLGGRNRLVGKVYAERKSKGQDATFEGLEAELLAGQNLQGALTSNEVQFILKRQNWEKEYPLFTTTNYIINGFLPPSAIVNYREAATELLRIKSEGGGGEPEKEEYGYLKNSSIKL